jgi:hypothetical protein
MLANLCQKIILTCIPTLTPLFKYYSEKSASRSRFGYTQHSANDTTIRGGITSKTTASSKGDWGRRESLDNSSQKNILGLSKSLEGQQENHAYELQAGSKGITATTRVEVSVRSLESVQAEDAKAFDKRW